jgi:hypothetical protein
MNIGLSAFDQIFHPAGIAAHPLACLATRLPLSLVVAGISLPPPRFVAVTRPDTPSSVPNHGF